MNMKRIVIDGRIRHGKPIIEGTRISVEDVLEMLESGMSYEEIEEEYGLTKEDILAVIKYVASLLRGEEVHELSN
ncbi:DUF433 domain-containing protein [Candidatus Pacearchaeota archaeon]|nr:DUF433 domain-containing protein [Candidatus Pacearchaeota archaeon]